MSWDGINRRKDRMNKDNFTPSTAFEGYVAAKLENIEKKFDDLPCAESFKRIGKCENKIANIEGKATILGIVSGFVAGIFAKIFIK